MAKTETKGSAETILDKLALLKLEHLEAPLHHLCEAFAGYPFDAEEECFFDELQSTLQDLITLQAAGETSRVLVQRLRIKIGSFSAWKYRAFVGNNPRRYWNPLDQSFNDFSNERADVQTQRVDDVYPPKDILRNWSNSHLPAQS